MDYALHYRRLIDRSPRKKPVTGFFERHHIIPKCMGGKNAVENLVYLTPEEHYVAHQFLVKMYPGMAKLIHAVQRMSNGRGNHRLYGWLRRKHSELLMGNNYAKLKPGQVSILKGRVPSSAHRAAISEAKKGRPFPVSAEWKSIDSSNRLWITDGKKSKFFPKSETIPKGWFPGRPYFSRRAASDEVIQRRVKTFKENRRVRNVRTNS
jgi:hypothetical protein